MYQRPKSVTVICWLLIITGSISLVASFINLNNPIVKEMMAKSPVPISIQYLMMYCGLAVTLLSGVAMLKRQNWARLLYVGWGILGFILGIATSPMKAAMIPGIIFFLIIVFFLFRPKANEYFKFSNQSKPYNAS